LFGVVLLVAPQLYGAPQPEDYTSAAPEVLAHEFVVMTTITNLLFWIVLGTLCGYFFNLLKQSSSYPETFGALRVGQAPPRG
jgi:predicted cobalt transporter CbtA